MKRNANQALLDEKPWGYDVEVFFNNGQPPKTFRKQGSSASVHRWAIMKTNHASHTISASYTRRQWVACFGDGRERM